MRYEILNPQGDVVSTIACDEAFAEAQYPGMWRAAAQQDAPAVPVLPPHITIRAFQSRFPASPDGVSTKYDALALFLTDAEYAADMEPDRAKRIGLKKLIVTGINRLTASAWVDFTLADAGNFTQLLMAPFIPADFRLSPAERAKILDPTTIQPGERPT